MVSNKVNKIIAVLKIEITKKKIYLPICITIIINLNSNFIKNIV